jgi:hypothetical protein
MKLPETPKEWAVIGKKIWWGLVRYQVLGLVIGALLTVFTQLLTGFWGFRDTHETMLRDQWKSVISAQETFESKLEGIHTILRGQPSPTAGSDYAQAAQTYVRSMEAVSRSLPGASDEIANYIEAIAALRRYYDVDDPPRPNTDEWTIFYGKFRQDFDRYVVAREEYYNLLGEKLGDYTRYLASS